MSILNIQKLMPMARKIFSIIFYVLSVFMLSGMSTIAFLDFTRIPEVQDDLPQFIMLIPVLINGIMFLVPFMIGLALSGFRNWKRDTSIVLLATCGYNALAILSMVAAYYTPEMREVMPDDLFGYFGNVALGVMFYAIMLSAGILLLVSHRKDVKKIAARQ
jgi:hypothetical protein